MKRFAFVLSIVILFAIPSSALADIAPPINPPGSNLNPGSEVTQVRMLAETVLVEVQKDITPGSLGHAHVTADFTMQNLGNESESLAVRFPIASNNGYDNSYPEITNIAIQVNGSGVGFRRSDYPAEFGWDANSIIPWAEFNVTFPVRKNVAIRVAYDLKGTGFPSQPYTSFYNVAKNPQDGEAWGRLGKAYKTAIITVKLFRSGPFYRSDPGGEELYQLSVDAYEKCLALLPNDALWHAGFAELLAIHANSNKESGEADRANEEISIALQLAPNHPLVLKSAYNVHGLLTDGSIDLQSGSVPDFPPPGPTYEPLPPVFSLAAIPGTYQITDVTYYGKNVELTFHLRSDFSATMEMKFGDGQTYTASGTWKADFVTINLSFVDQFKEPLTFELFVKEPPSHSLVINSSPYEYSFNKNADPELINLAYPPTQTNTPAPTSTRRPTTPTLSRTPRPTFSPVPTKTPRPTQTTQPTPSKPTSTPAPKTPSSVCGSAMLIPLIAIIPFVRMRTRRRY